MSDDNLDDLEYLKERAIDPEIARAAKVRLHDAAEYAEFIGYTGDVSGTAIVFPYQNAPSYSRARMEGDGPRWISPAGSDVSIYVFDTPRAPVAESEFLVVVESPAKALALISAGIAAIGLGGIATTLDASHCLNRSWTPLKVRGRQVVVLPDSDVHENHAVARAVATLTTALRIAGANTFVALLPDTPGEKGGPDDFLKVKGADALRQVLTDRVCADPVKWFEEAKDSAELLNCLPWLASIDVGREAVQARVQGAAKVRGLSVTLLQKSLKRYRDQLAARDRAEARRDEEPASAAEHFEDDDGLHQRMGDGLRRLANVTGRILRQYVVRGADGDRREFVLELFKNGSSLGQRTIVSSELHRSFWIDPFGADVIVYVPPHEFWRGLQSMSPDVPEVVGTDQIGFLLGDDGQPTYVTSNRCVGPGNIRGSKIAARYSMPERVERIEDAADETLRLLDVAGTEFGYLGLGVVGASFAATLLPPEFVVGFIGKSGRHKSSLASVLLSFFGRFESGKMPADFSGTHASLELLAHLVGDALLVIDEYTPREQHDRMITTATKLVQAIANRASRPKLDSRHAFASDRTPRGLVLIIGEQAIGGHSSNARLLLMPFDTLSADLKALSRLQTASTLLNAFGRAIVEWLLVHYEILSVALPELLAAYQTVFRQMPNPSHERLPTQLAHVLVGIHIVLEVMLSRAGMTDELARVYFRDAQLALANLATKQQSKQDDADPVQQFASVLIELIQSQPTLIRDLEMPASTSTSPLIGYRDGDDLHLLATPAYQHVVRHLGPSAYLPPAVSIYRALLDAGVVRRGSADRPHSRNVELKSVGKVRVTTLSWGALVKFAGGVADRATSGAVVTSIEFRRIAVRRENVALAAYVVVMNGGAFVVRDERGSATFVSIVELKGWIEGRDPFHSVLAWAPYPHEVWAALPRHTVDVRRLAHVFGHSRPELARVARDMGLASTLPDEDLLEQVARTLYRSGEVSAIRRLLDLEADAALVADRIGRRGLLVNREAARERVEQIATDLAHVEAVVGDMLDMEPCDLRNLERVIAATADLMGLGDTGVRSLADLEGMPDDFCVLPFVSEMLSTRAKLSAAKILGSAGDDGVLHFDLNPLGTSTGRFTSSSPNVLGLPRAREFRALVRARDGFEVQAHDFRAFEFTVLASLSREPAFLGWLEDGRDPYHELSMLFVEAGVTSTGDRSLGKAAFMLLAYGAGKKTLIAKAQEAGHELDSEIADHIMQRVDTEYWKALAFLRAVERDDTLVRSVLGRRAGTETLAERTRRRNFPMQSTAAEIFKLALIRADAYLTDLGGYVLLPLHDELFVEVPHAFADAAAEELPIIMGEAFASVLPGVVVRSKTKRGTSFAFDDEDE